MPFPLLILPVVAAAAVVGTALIAVVPRIWKILDQRTVAILGARQTGKTALLRLLRDIDAPEAALPSTASGAVSGRFELDIKGETIKFALPRDLPGSDGFGQAEWKEAFGDADHVWYLFRADLIARGDPETTQMVRTHLELLKKWRSAVSGKTPQIILVGTWADEYSDGARHPARVARAVGDSDVIRFGAVKLGGAPVVVGSLASARDADRLLRGIKGHLH